MAKTRQPSKSNSMLVEDTPSAEFAAPPVGVLEADQSYVQVPGELLAQDNAAVEEIRQISLDASYMLLDQREGQWCLMAFGAMGGANLRSFPTLDEGIQFVREAGIKNCRCLAIPSGRVE